jgi:hypothetical protein
MFFLKKLAQSVASFHTISCGFGITGPKIGLSLVTQAAYGGFKESVLSRKTVIWGMKNISRLNIFRLVIKK